MPGVLARLHRRGPRGGRVRHDADAACRSRTATARRCRSRARPALADRQGALSSAIRSRVVVAETAGAGARTRPRRSMLDIEPLPAVTDARAAAAAPARRCSMTTRRATSRSTFITATPRRSRRRSPRPRTSRRLTSATTASSSARWSRAPRSRHTTRRAAAARCTSAARACSGMQGQLRRRARRAAEKVRVLTGNVGGSFGMKASVYPEYVCLLHAARALGPAGEMDRRALRELPVRQPRPRPRDRPASWRSTRTGTFLALRLDRLRQYRRLSQQRVAPLPPTLQHREEQHRRLSRRR